MLYQSVCPLLECTQHVFVQCHINVTPVTPSCSSEFLDIFRTQNHGNISIFDLSTCKMIFWVLMLARKQEQIPTRWRVCICSCLYSCLECKKLISASNLFGFSWFSWFFHLELDVERSNLEIFPLLWALKISKNSRLQDGVTSVTSMWHSNVTLHKNMFCTLK